MWADNADICSVQYAGTSALKTDYTRYYYLLFRKKHVVDFDTCQIKITEYIFSISSRLLRTGKRTKMGLLKDGWNSLVRYYKNNFSDGFRQDSIDLLLGNYQVDDGEGVTKPSPFRQDQDWRYLAVSLILKWLHCYLHLSPDL